MKSKKLTFDGVPSALEELLTLVKTGGGGGSALPDDLLQRLTRLEKKVDSIQQAVFPDRPTMDLQAVCRALKIRPKIAHQLADQGILPSRTEGRKILFYEDGVVKYHMTQPVWKADVTNSEPSKSIPAPVTSEGKQPINVDAASVVLGKSKAAIYQLTAKNLIPFHKDGPKKIHFFEDELTQWLNTPRKRAGRKAKAKTD